MLRLPRESDCRKPEAALMEPSISLPCAARVSDIFLHSCSSRLLGMSRGSSTTMCPGITSSSMPLRW